MFQQCRVKSVTLKRYLKTTSATNVASGRMKRVVITYMTVLHPHQWRIEAGFQAGLRRQMPIYEIVKTGGGAEDACLGNVHTVIPMVEFESDLELFGVNNLMASNARTLETVHEETQQDIQQSDQMDQEDPPP